MGYIAIPMPYSRIGLSHEKAARGYSKRRCFKPVDSVLEQPPKFVTVDEQSNHQIMHPLRLGKADRTAHQALDSRPEPDMFALNLLGIIFAHHVLLCIEMSLVRAPAIGVITRDAKRL